MKSIFSRENNVYKQLKKFFRRFFHPLLTAKSFTSVILLIFAFAILFEPVLKSKNTYALISLAIFISIIIILCIVIIYEFIMKTYRLQTIFTQFPFTLFTTINTLFGLILPIGFLNYLTSNLIYILKIIPNKDTFICEIREIIVRSYYNLEIYENVQLIIPWSIVLLFGFFLFGSLIEKNLSKRSR